MGHPIVVEREKFYNDLLGSIVASATDLPALGNMILMPSDASGVERQDDGLTNVRGGDVYLNVDYATPGVYTAYVTICDETDPSYRMTVPVTIYAMEAKDSTFVLDYGLDTVLSDGTPLFQTELDLAVGGNVTGTVLDLVPSTTGDSELSYKPYDTGIIDTAVGNTPNDLTWVKGSYADGTFSNGVYQLGSPIYLEHTKPWVIEFSVGYMKYNDCLLSAAGTKMIDDKLERLYLTNTGIGLGTSDGTDEIFYGVAYDKFRAEEMTTVKLFNVPAGDGSNMVYCSINGGAAAAMNNYFVNRTSQNKTDSTWINGRDFIFEYLGCNGHALNLKMDYLRIYEAGEQLTHYRWEARDTGFESTSTTQTGFQANAVTDANSQEGYDRWALNDYAVLNSDRAWEIEFGMQLPATATNFMLLSSTEGRVTNNEVYMDGSSGNSSIAFVVYADPARQSEALGLQIAVRAIDRGNFYGTGSTGLGAALELGVLDKSGTNCWMPLATVTSGTEQYVTIPYELCPVVINDQTQALEYHVIIRVGASSESIGPMISFSTIKHSEGMLLKESISDQVTIQQDTNGQWVTSEGETEGVANILTIRRGMAAQTVISKYEAVPGEEFVGADTTPDSQPAIAPKYPSLSFEGEVRYNIYYTVQELGDVALEDMGLITFDHENVDGTISDAKDIIPGAIFNGSLYMVRTNGIPANTPDDGMTLYYWNIDDYLAADVLTVDNATRSMEMVATDEANQYWGNVTGIAAKELDQTVFVVGVYEHNGTTYTTGVLNYSIGKYCEGIAAKDTSDQQSFAQATAVYGYCAKEYFANL